MTLRAVLLLTLGCRIETSAADGAVAQDGSKNDGIALVSSTKLPGGATDVAFISNGALALGQDDLLKLDLADPAAPATALSTGWGGLGLQILDDTLYVATGMTLLEASVASKTPKFTQEYKFGTRAANRAYVVGRNAYIASNNDLLVLDLDRDPPFLVAIGMGDEVLDLVANQQLVFAAVNKRGIGVVDGATSPATATAYQIETEGPALAVFLLAENQILVGASDEVVSFQIDDPSHPERLSRLFVSGYAFAVTAKQAYVLGDACLYEVDVSDPNNLQKQACHSLAELFPKRAAPTHGRGFAVLDGLGALAMDGELGLFLLP